MRVEKAFVGARGVDSVQFSMGGSATQAEALKRKGIDFFVGYLGAMNAARLAAVLAAGLAFMPVTYAGEYEDGAEDEIAQLKALGVPQGTTVWLDLEGQKAFDTPSAQLIAKINAWADKIIAAGYLPGLYIGSPQPLTGDELAKLKVVRYWKAPSRVFDHDGKAWDGPSAIGFCMWQMWPSVMWFDTNIFLDVDFIGQDFKGRVPTWVVAD